MTKINAEQMISFMENMDNGERLTFLEYLFHNHFDIRPTGNRIVATTNYIEDQLDRKLTAEELEIMKLAYDTAYGFGCKDGMDKALKSEK
ncbi:hypothetical protein [Priestia megaterium]|uniref:hypothetical protein n=1 Tax=Priestia megaterium TaxID=1404 RepID=UPI000BFB2DDD|nr:hypothetical protein [Priestia megaterium]PGT75540.1 hypothetical protein COD15_07300 [Priestia megaterium]